MSNTEIDDYINALDEPKRATLLQLRATIAKLVPDAEEGLSYGVPVFRIGGRPIAGFSAAKNHLSYLPHSGDILATVDPADLEGFSATKGAVKMPTDTALPEALVAKLIDARRREAGV